MREEEDQTIYSVVSNHEEQYSIWPADREPPAGWKRDGKSGTKAECLDHIAVVWTDMRPLSLRKKMEELENAPPPPVEPFTPTPPHPLGKNELVERLETPQPVEAGLRPEPLVKYLKDAVDRGYVFMKFSNTGTELGIRLDRSECDLHVDWDEGTGVATFVGNLVLNYNRVRYRGDLDLATLRGTGGLEFIEAVKPGQAIAGQSEN